MLSLQACAQFRIDLRMTPEFEFISSILQLNSCMQNVCRVEE